MVLLEAGDTDWYPWIHVPVGYLYTMMNPWTCWCFNTTEQPEAARGQHPCTVGAGHDCGLYLISIAQALSADTVEGGQRTSAEAPAAVQGLTPAGVGAKRAQLLGLVEAYAT